MNRIDLRAGKGYLLFDGDCGICTWSSETAKRMDGDKRFIVEPYQIFDESELMRFGISYSECSKRLQIITGQGSVHAGAFAVNYFLWKQFPWTLLVFLIYALPLLLLLELIGYRLVATNRHLISQWLGMKACSFKR